MNHPVSVRHFSNPISEGADPWVIRHEGKYYWCLSATGRGVYVFSSDRLHSLGERHLVWSAPQTGPWSDQVWAPELHRLGDTWYIYTTASDGENANHRVIVLERRAADPVGPFTFKAQLYTGDSIATGTQNRWAIDATPLPWQGKLYLLWSGWEAEVDEQWLYIAPLSNPWTVSGNRVRLCPNDDHLWERVDETPDGRGLNEAPQILQRQGRTFVIFSASGSWQASYKLGLLELKGADPLLPASWEKYPEPVFVANDATWGVGHGSFTQSPDGREDWMTYHAKETKGHDWLRSIFIQPFGFSPAGFPHFPSPSIRGEPLALPAGTSPTAAGGTFKDDFAQDWRAWEYFGHHDLIASTAEGLLLGEFGPHLALFRSGEKILIRDRTWKTFRMRVEFSAADDTEFGVLFGVTNPHLGFDGQEGYGVCLNNRTIRVCAWENGLRHDLHQASGEIVSNRSVLEVEVTSDAIQVVQPLPLTMPADAANGQIGLRLGKGKVRITRVTVDTP